MSAAWESLHRATLELASQYSIKQRLTRAFSSHLQDLDPADLPAEVRGRFTDLAARMTRVPPLRGETAVSATVRKMSNDEAGECAQQIVDILAALGVQQGEVQRPRPRKVLSLYAAEA